MGEKRPIFHVVSSVASSPLLGGWRSLGPAVSCARLLRGQCGKEGESRDLKQEKMEERFLLRKIRVSISMTDHVCSMRLEKHGENGAHLQNTESWSDYKKNIRANTN